MEGLVKGVSLSSLFVGLGASTVIFCATAFFGYMFVGGKEPSALIAGNQNMSGFKASLRIADKISRFVPAKNKFPLRIALRKLLAVVLMFVAVMSFSVCMMIGQSLNISSQKVFESQTLGHNYEYDTRYLDYRPDATFGSTIAYLDAPLKLYIGEHETTQTATGLYNLNNLYELQNNKGEMLDLPKAGMAYIHPGLHEVYGVNIGDTLSAEIAGIECDFVFADIAVSAKSASVYINAQELARILEVPDGTYNGVLSMEQLHDGVSMSSQQRIDTLKKNAVSNNISAVINQATGGVVGIMLIFLALYVNFQDNTREMLILRMMGYKEKEIRKLLVNVYRPIVWVAFLLTLAPSIWLAKSIQRSLSISTNDYMPFGTNILVIFIVFVILTIIYWLVQSVFGVGIRCNIAKEVVA